MTSNAKIRVLVAEDEMLNQEYIKALLECCDADYLVVGNGEEVLTVLKNASFDLLFLDCQMPVMDGWTTIKKIRELEEVSHQHLPVFALTGSGLTGDDQIFKDAGMDGFILKPPGVVEIRKLFSEITTGKYSLKPLINEEKNDFSIKSNEIDRAFLEKKYAAMPGLLKTLAAMFCQTSLEIESKLVSSILSKSVSDVVFLAHKFKGMCSNFGESEIWRFLNHLELNFAQSTESEIELAARLEKYYHSFKKEIESLL